MRKLAQWVIVGAVLSASSVGAQWRQEGVEVPDTPWQQSRGEFGAMLMITDQPDDFFEQWNHPPSPEYKPELISASEAMRGETVVAVIVFSGCQADERGNCDAEVDFRVLFPDGSVYAEHLNGELWKDKPAPGTYLQLSVASLGLRIEPDDPFGMYRIEAVVRDNNAAAVLSLVQEVAVVVAKGE